MSSVTFSVPVLCEGLGFFKEKKPKSYLVPIIFFKLEFYKNFKFYHDNLYSDYLVLSTRGVENIAILFCNTPTIALIKRLVAVFHFRLCLKVYMSF